MKFLFQYFCLDFLDIMENNREKRSVCADNNNSNSNSNSLLSFLKNNNLTAGQGQGQGALPNSGK